MKAAILSIILLSYFGCFSTVLAQADPAGFFFGDSPAFSEGHIMEGGSVSFTVSARGHTATASVSYRFVAQTAMAEIDFTPQSGSFEFAPNERVKYLPISLPDNSEIDGPRTFQIELFDPAGLPILTRSLLITILDDERGYFPTQASGREGDFAQIQISRLGDFDISSSVEVFFTPGTAQPGIDYVNESFVVSFAPGQTAATVRARLLDNSTEQPRARTFTANLRNPQGLPPIWRADAEVIIIDDEEGYVVHKSRRGTWDADLFEGGDNFFVLERRGDYDQPSTATVFLRAITPEDNVSYFVLAEEGQDFQAREISVPFAADQRLARVPLPIINDSAGEDPLEYFALLHTTSLSDPSLTVRFASIRDNDNASISPVPACVGPQIVPVDHTPLQSGGVVIATSGSDAYTTVLHRYSSRGEYDTTFQSPLLQGSPRQVREGSDGRLLVATVTSSNTHLLRQVLPDGAINAAFPEIVFTSPAHFVPAADGKWMFVRDHEIVRMTVDWTVDPTFAPIPFVQVYSLTGFPNGEFQVDATKALPGGAESRGLWHFDASGTPNETSPFRTAELVLGGEPFARRFEGPPAGFLVRLAAGGQPDPGFVPIPEANAEFAADAEGRIYRFVQHDSGSHVVIDRFLPSGNPDTTFQSKSLSGLIGRDFGIPVFLESPIALLLSQFEAFAGECDPGVFAYIARIDFENPPLFRLWSDAPLYERATGIQQRLAVTRSGDPSREAVFRFRVNPGSAVPGVHFEVPGAAEIRFAPGASHAFLPVNTIDNSTVDGQRVFSIDFLPLNEEAILATLPVSLIDDEFALDLVRLDNANGFFVRITESEYSEYPAFYLETSSDLREWYFSGTFARPGFSINIPPLPGTRFFRVQVGPSSFSWDTEPP